MTEKRTITLAGKKFAAPNLPIRVNRAAYPLCRKLTNSGLLERAAKASGALDCSQEEMDDLADLAFMSAGVAEPGLTRDAFDELAITPPELLDAFFVIRYQTGGWVPVTATEGGDAAGEVRPARRPRK